jgi:hypothetical protein
LFFRRCLCCSMFGRKEFAYDSTLTKTEAATMISQAEEFLALAEQALGAQPPAMDQSEAEDPSEQC